MVCEFAAHCCPHVRRTAVGGRATGTPSLDAVLFTCLTVLWYATPSILLGSSCSAVGTDAWGLGVGLAFGTGCVGCRQVAIMVSCEEQAHTCYTHAHAETVITSVCSVRYRYFRYRYECRTELTEVSGTGIDVVPNSPKCPDRC